MEKDVQVYEFEQDGIAMSLAFRALDDDHLVVELHDHYPPVRALHFTAVEFDSMMAGKQESIESFDRQCALKREGEMIEIVFSSPEVAEQVECQISVGDLVSAITDANASAYVS